MALKKCPECGSQLSTKARFCPHCGARRMPKAALAFAMVALITLISVGVALYMSAPHH